MNAKSVNDLFSKAWAEYYDLRDELTSFCEENNIDSGLLKMEMMGPRVHIKHYCTPKLWTEDLHNKLCEALGVHLTYFNVEYWASRRNESHKVSYKWVYSVELDEIYILDYNEVLSI